VRGKVLFLEDLDELLYHVDRMIMNLRASGWHQQIAGLLVGGMTDMWDKNKQDPFGHSAEQIIRDTLGRPGIPIGFGFPAGHESDNRALVLGQKVKLSVSANGTQLSFQ
jgi:muramoyltetrapeptide carboxypeptidase